MIHYTHYLAPLATTPEQLVALQTMKAISLQIRAETPKILGELRMKIEERERLRLEAEVGFKRYQGE